MASEKILSDCRATESPLEKEIVKISDRAIALLNERERLKNRLISVKRSDRNPALTKKVGQELANLKKSIQRVSRSWAGLLKQVANSPVFNS